MLARQMHRDSLCPDCGQPRDRAWHPQLEGWYETGVRVCHGCKALHDAKADPHQKVYLLDTYDEGEEGPLGPLPPPMFDDDAMPRDPEGGE